MAGRIEHEALLGALACRYDFHSAHAILLEALQHAGMATAATYSPEELSRIVWGLNEVGQRAQPAVMALFELVGEAATAELPDEAEGEEVDEADLPMLLAQVVDAAVASARWKAEARARPPATDQPSAGQLAPDPSRN